MFSLTANPIGIEGMQCSFVFQTGTPFDGNWMDMAHAIHKCVCLYIYIYIYIDRYINIDMYVCVCVHMFATDSGNSTLYFFGKYGKKTHGVMPLV